MQELREYDPEEFLKRKDKYEARQKLLDDAVGNVADVKNIEPIGEKFKSFNFHEFLIIGWNMKTH